MLDDVAATTISFATKVFGTQPVPINAWVGYERSIITMHAHPFENLYVIASGLNPFVLQPPCEATFLPNPNLQCVRCMEIGATEEDGHVVDSVDDATVLAPNI